MIDKIPDFNAVAKKLIKDAQTIAEVEMINFINRNFENQGFMDGSLQPWTGRKNGNDTGRAILKKTGELQDRISVTSSSSKQIVVTAAAKYAKLHNEGGTVNIPVTPKMKKWFWYMYKTTKNERYKAMALSKKTAFSFTMPQRQFMGPSIAFNKLIEQKFLNMIEMRFKQA